MVISATSQKVQQTQNNTRIYFLQLFFDNLYKNLKKPLTVKKEGQNEGK